MIDATKIEASMRSLDTYAGYLRRLAVIPKDDLLADFTKTGSVRYYLHVAIECCLDAANHIIAARSLRPPSDYADTKRTARRASRPRLWPVYAVLKPVCRRGSLDNSVLHTIVIDV